MQSYVNLHKRRQIIYGWLLLSPAALLLTTFAFYPSIATLWASVFSRGTRENHPNSSVAKTIRTYLRIQHFY